MPFSRFLFVLFVFFCSFCFCLVLVSQFSNWERNHAFTPNLPSHQHFLIIHPDWFVLSWWKVELVFEQAIISCMLFMSCFSFSLSQFIPTMPTLSYVPYHPSIHPSIFLCHTLPCFVSPAPSPSLSPKIFHLKNLENADSNRQSRSPSPTHSASSSSSSLSSSSFSSGWYSPSVWPSCEECCHYILRALVATYLLLFFASSFLVFFSDHPATCHHGPHHTLTQGPAPHLGVPRPSMDPTDSQCKSVFPPCFGQCCKLSLHLLLLKLSGRKETLKWISMFLTGVFLIASINHQSVTLHVASHHNELLMTQKQQFS